MSQSGLAKLCGVSRSTIQRLLDKPAQELPTEQLQALLDKEKWLPTIAPNKADVIPSLVCAEVISYFAFEAKHKSEIAQYSFKKFAAIGIDSWIKEVTGYATEVALHNHSELIPQLLGTLKQVLTEVTELKETTQAYRNMKGVTTKVFPNLDDMLTKLEIEDEFDELEPDVKEMTATEWLAKNDITLGATKKRQFSLLLSETYKAVTGKDPKTVNKRGKNGKWNNGVSVYHFSEYPILQLCLNKLFVKEIN